MREFKVPSALCAFAMVFALGCGGGGIKTTHKADGQVTTCFYGGKTYNPGDSFREDCNTCSCGSNGQVGCALMLCPTDAGSDLARDAALADAQADGTLPLDQAKDVKPTIDLVDVLADLSPDLPPAADSAQDALLVTDTAQDSQLVVDARDVGGDVPRAICIWTDKVLSVGQSIDTADGCHTCECTVAGMACRTRACVPAPDAAALVCSLSSALSWYAMGNGLCGAGVQIDSYVLNGGTQMTVDRVHNNCGIDQQIFRSCSPALPACGAPGVVSISTIAQDLISPDVQAALGSTQVSVYGRGSAWSIAYAGGTIQVGYSCPSPVMDSCQPIPPGIQILTDDLKGLAAAMVASPECAGL